MYIYCRITCRSRTLVESEAKNSDWFFFSLGLIKGIAALYENTHSFYLIGTFNCGRIFWLMEWILQCTNQLYLFSCQVCEVRAVWILYHPAVYTLGCLYTRYYHQYICFNEELISTPQLISHPLLFREAMEFYPRNKTFLTSTPGEYSWWRMICCCN